ncbi:MAG: NUDIX hydrolase [Oscillospiraceae bacterium]|nr:NUDIX hydrolase [Oscillospiraceae bacterium]
MEYKNGSLCLVVRDNKILMVKHKRSEKNEYYTLPGGGIEKDETPEQAAIRELQEECSVSGVIIKKLCEYLFPFGDNVKIHTFYIGIGNQKPILGSDPELAEENQILTELKWMALDEICERDRAFLWAAGLAGVEYYFNELTSWGDDISYPTKR